MSLFYLDFPVNMIMISCRRQSLASSRQAVCTPSSGEILYTLMPNIA